MKMILKPIIADPLNLERHGVFTMRQASILIHIGRCGTVGVTIPQITAGLCLCGSTVTSIVNILLEAKLVTMVGRSNAPGRVATYTVTVKGWEVLTMPADLSMFPWAQEELRMRSRKKSTQEERKDT